MTTTLLSLLSIVIGILGANMSLVFFRKYSFGLIGNTISGVFGSVFVIKSFGRLGFDPAAILQTGELHYVLFCINVMLSFLGGFLAVVLLQKLKGLMTVTG